MKILKLSLGLFSVSFSNRIIFQPHIYNQDFISAADSELDKNFDYCDRTQVILFKFLFTFEMFISVWIRISPDNIMVYG